MLGMVLACETPTSRGVGVLVYSRFGCGGDGVLDLMIFSKVWCWDKGDGAMRRGSIFDIGGVDDGLLFLEGC